MQLNCFVFFRRKALLYARFAVMGFCGLTLSVVVSGCTASESRKAVNVYSVPPMPGPYPEGVMLPGVPPYAALPPPELAVAGPGPVPGTVPVPQFPKPDQKDLVVLSGKLSGGAVEVYDLEGSAMRPSSATDGGKGVPFAMDPSITVFPIDGESAYPAHGMNNVGEIPSPYVEREGLDGFSAPLPSGFVPVRRPGILAGGAPAQVYFQHGSASLNQEARQVLSSVAEDAKFSPVDRIRVEGHASSRAQTHDPVTNKVLNLKESMNRAFAVSEDLIRKGVPAEKIQTTGWGDTMAPPEIPGKDAEAAARRVDVFSGAQ